MLRARPARVRSSHSRHSWRPRTSTRPTQDDRTLQSRRTGTQTRSTPRRIPLGLAEQRSDHRHHPTSTKQQYPKHRQLRQRTHCPQLERRKSLERAVESVPTPFIDHLALVPSPAWPRHLVRLLPPAARLSSWVHPLPAVFVLRWTCPWRAEHNLHPAFAHPAKRHLPPLAALRVLPTSFPPGNVLSRRRPGPPKVHHQRR